MSSTNTESILLGEDLTIGEIWQASQHPERIDLGNSQIQRIKTCRSTLDRINKKEEPVYGVSTGFGHLENKWIPPEKQSQLQINLLRSHAIATGDQIPEKITHIAMILLANSLAKGHSGIRLSTLKRIIFFIKHQIIPITYTIGSLGASGDLAPLAHLALGFIGEGDVSYQGRRYSGEEILEELDLSPLELKAKEGLALINGTHFITAYATNLLHQTKSLLKCSLLASALSIESLRATDTPFRLEIGQLRSHPGHLTISNIMQQILDGSQIISSHKDPRIDHKTQDAYAFRCIPQVMGAIWDALAYLERVVRIEINSVTDNPLVFPASDEIISGGNFHAEPLGFPLETSCLALIELANITEARVSRLVSPFTPELPAFLANKPGIESGYMIAHYTVAALVNKLRGLAHPNITDNIPVSGNQEDHVSMAMNTAVRSDEIFKLVKEVVLFELMMAIRGLNLVDHQSSSSILEEVIEHVNNSIPFERSDHVIHHTLTAFKDLYQTGKFEEIFDRYIDFPQDFGI